MTDRASEEGAIGFDLAGWHLMDPATPGVWHSERGAHLVLRRLLGPFDVPGEATDEDLRTFFAPTIEQERDRLLDVRWTWTDDVRGVRLTTEEPLDRFEGKAYHISLMIPYGRTGWSISLRAKEEGTTGFREAVLTDRFLHEAGSDLDEDALGLIMHRVMTEGMAEQWDPEFPDHPLSVVRSAVARIEETITFHPDVPLQPVPQNIFISMVKAGMEPEPEAQGSGWRQRRRERRRRRHLST